MALRRGHHFGPLPRYCLISLTIMILFTFYGRSNNSYSNMSAFCMHFSQLGLMFNNSINAIGKYIGEGSSLRILSKGRFLFHVVGILLLGIPVTENHAIRCYLCGIFVGCLRGLKEEPLHCWRRVLFVLFEKVDISGDWEFHQILGPVLI
jgi:hypothetical protein